MLETCEIPIPPSANQMWQIVAPKGRRRTPFMKRSTTYKKWLNATALLLKVSMPPARLPAAVVVTIRGGKGWRQEHGKDVRDIDNLLKPIMDALVLAERIPGDSSEHVHFLSIQYRQAVKGKPALCTVSYLTTGAPPEAAGDAKASQDDIGDAFGVKSLYGPSWGD